MKNTFWLTIYAPAPKRGIMKFLNRIFYVASHVVLTYISSSARKRKRLLFRFSRSTSLMNLLTALSFLPAWPVLAQNIGVNGENSIIDQIGAKAGYQTGGKIANDIFLNTLTGELIAYILGFVGLIFLIIIIYSGIQWMTAGGNEEKVENSKKRIIQASIGLALVLFSYMIVYWVIMFFYSQPGITN